MGTIKRRLILFIMQSALYHWLMRHVIWKIRFTTYYSNFSGVKFKEGYSILKPGDVILTTDSLKMTCKLIPGILDHAAFCIGKSSTSEKPEVAEMVHCGYREVSFFDVCKESTRVVLMRSRLWDEHYINLMIRCCRSFVRASYDTDFDLGIKALYCSELIFHSDFLHKIRLNLEDFAGIGRPYISPMGILYSPDLYCAFDSDNEFTGLHGDEIEKKLRGKYA